MALQMRRSEETESEEEGEEVNQLVDEDDKRGTKMSQWKRLRQSKRRMSSPCTKSTTMLSSPWTLWRPSTHMMTHERPWIFEDVELFDELDRAELDQGWGYTFLAKGEKKMVTFRQLEILFGFTMEKEPMEHQGKELQRVWATIAEEGYSSSRSKAAQIRVLCLDMSQGSCNTFFARKATGQSMRENSTYKITAYNTRHQRGRKLSVGGVITPIFVQQESSGQEKVYSTRLDGHQVLQDQPLIEHKELDGRFQFKFTHPLAGPPSFFCPTLSSPQSRR
ncbi:unnamed protein product [Microthlaspi erraticum]|uniref:Arabidopsis retrotransposon Orf1 C-terminal domain-containing protein n=1 Tax=Microthlaspi erraticum TaxID=1685480 RepID=A0A6D2JVA0_9BRAS|nr:unnamed protein product [Microthlaspi erraticum]